MTVNFYEFEVFNGSCPKCGVYQTHSQERCSMSGCLTLHYYPEIKCNCGEVLVYKSGSGNMMSRSMDC